MKIELLYSPGCKQCDAARSELKAAAEQTCSNLLLVWTELLDYAVELGVALLGAFAIGRSIPIAIGALSIGWLERFQFAARFRRRFDVVGGVILILAGLYMLNAYFFLIPVLAG